MIYLYTFRPNHFHTAERLAQTFQFKDAVSGSYVSKRAIFARRNQIFIAARTIYYFYRGHNKNCLCGINLLFVLRYALPVVFSEREMARPSRLNFSSNDCKPCRKIDGFANRVGCSFWFPISRELDRWRGRTLGEKVDHTSLNVHNE